MYDLVNYFNVSKQKSTNYFAKFKFVDEYINPVNTRLRLVNLGGGAN